MQLSAKWIPWSDRVLWDRAYHRTNYNRAKFMTHWTRENKWMNHSLMKMSICDCTHEIKHKMKLSYFKAINLDYNTKIERTHL